MSRIGPPARVRRLLLLATMASAACATGGTATPFVFRGDRQPEGTRILVNNPHWEDLTIYLDRQGTRFRLGVVPGNESRTLGVEDTYIGVNCWARLIAMTTGREPHAVSEVFALARGDYAVWDVGLIGRSTPVRLEDPPAP